MSSPLDRLSVLTAWISRLCLWLSASGLVLMTAVIGWQVWGRYVLNDTPNWSERLSLFLMIYFILFAAAAGVHEGFHLGLVVIRDALPKRARRVAGVLINLAVGGFGCGMVWFGAQTAAATWPHTIPTLGLSTGIYYLPFPIAGAIIAFFSLVRILNALAGRETGTA